MANYGEALLRNISGLLMVNGQLYNWYYDHYQGWCKVHRGGEHLFKFPFDYNYYTSRKDFIKLVSKRIAHYEHRLIYRTEIVNPEYPNTDWDGRDE